MYDKVGNKVKQATAHCPKCLGTKRFIDIDYVVHCLTCGWIGYYEEMAFMKLRSKKSVPMRNGNPNYYMNKKTKYGGKDGQRNKKSHRTTIGGVAI